MIVTPHNENKKTKALTFIHNSVMSFLGFRYKTNNICVKATQEVNDGIYLRSLSPHK